MRVFASAVLLATSTALRLPAVARGSSTCSSPSLGRRDAVASGLLGAALGGLLVPPQAAFASGGATSGKTTSIPRAKLRYYGRMTTVITIFQGMKKPILAGDVKGAKGSFFTKEYETQDSSMSTAIDELKTAGYLLAVAFKIDSKIPPDKIQQVKDYKKLMAEMEKLKEALGSGKSDKAAAAYEKVASLMNVYLEGVELPELGDERYTAGAEAPSLEATVV